MSSNAHPQTRTPHRLSALGPLAVLAGLAAFVARVVVSGGEALRGLVLGGLVAVMALPLLASLEAGLVAMMLFEPLRGFIRRAQYLVVPYTETDPIHVLTPAVTFLAFAVLFRLRGPGIFRGSPLAGLVSALGVIYLIQVFNPLQGGLFVGLSGALFMLVPVAWFYFGQEVKSGFILTVLRLVVVMGLVTSLHGLYQMMFGYPGFEQYWVEHTEFYDSIAIGQVKRAIATFSSAEEWSRYIELGAVIAFGLGLGAGRLWHRSAWFLCGAALSLMTVLTGHRTSIFGLIFGVGVLVLCGAKTWLGAVGRLALLLAPVVIVLVLARPPTEDEVWEKDEAVEVVLSHATRGTLRPTSEGSWQARVEAWTFFATKVVPSHPFGVGLGATSLGSARFQGGVLSPPVEGYVFSLVVTCGLPTALLFLWILWRAAAISRGVLRRQTPGTREAGLWRVAAALVPVLILNNVFGTTFTLYSAAPIGWLLVGWISAEKLRAEAESDGGVRSHLPPPIRLLPATGGEDT